MIFKRYIFLIVIVVLLPYSFCSAQVKGNDNKQPKPKQELPKDEMQNSNSGYRVSTYVYHGDTIPNILYQSFYVYPPLKFATNQERMEYIKLVYNVKKVLPVAIQLNNLIIETAEYLETLPNDKAKISHIKRVEKGLREQYTAQMKKLTYKQGKLLIKLIDRQTHQSSYELVKAFFGPVKAAASQAFAWFYGASLKKTYDPEGEDKLTERVVTQVMQKQV
jgi:hypothetical protein